MIEHDERCVGTVARVDRYPVKSMRGEACEVGMLTERGMIGDRAWAVLDLETGKVASAKRPKLWRGLLACGARTIADGRHVEVVLPDGSCHYVGDRLLDRTLSALMGRQIQVSAVPPFVAEVDRAHPEALLTTGPDAEVASDILKLGAAAPPGTFFDYAPLHLVTTATLDGLSEALPDGPVESARYRPNIVIRSPDELETISRKRLGWRSAADWRSGDASGRFADAALRHPDARARRAAAAAWGSRRGYQVQPYRY